MPILPDPDPGALSPGGVGNGWALGVRGPPPWPRLDRPSGGALLFDPPRHRTRRCEVLPDPPCVDRGWGRAGDPLSAVSGGDRARSRRGGGGGGYGRAAGSSCDGGMGLWSRGDGRWRRPHDGAPRSLSGLEARPHCGLRGGMPRPSFLCALCLAHATPRPLRRIPGPSGRPALGPAGRGFRGHPRPDTPEPGPCNDRRCARSTRRRFLPASFGPLPEPRPPPSGQG